VNAIQPFDEDKHDFTSKQVQRFLSLVKTPKSNIDKLLGHETWLLESGASCHTTGAKDYLQDTYDIDPISIDLPNGIQTTATKKDQHLLIPSFVLKEVLYVPNLQCSLISIVQLIEDFCCTTTVTPKVYVI